MIELLKPIFRGGPWASYAEGLMCAEIAAPDEILLAELLDSSNAVTELLARQARLFGTNDLRPIASAWMLKYTALLLPPVAAAATVLQHAFPVKQDEVRLKLDKHGTPLAVLILHLGRRAVGEDTPSRYTTLLDEHLAPLINSLSIASRLPTKILWGSVSRRLDALLEQAKAVAPTLDSATRITADREYLLQQAVWPDGRRNPLFGPRKSVLQKSPEGQKHILLHRQCCLYYRLPGEDYCRACPLSPEFRVSRMRQRTCQ